MWMMPDTDNHLEMQLVLGLVAALARADPWVFVFLLFLLMGYALARLVMSMAKYLFALYRERLVSTSPYARYFQLALAIGVIGALVGIAMWSREETAALGFAILAYAFCLFSLVSVGLDWYVTSRTPPPAAPTQGVTLDDIIGWQMQVAQAQQAGLMQKVP